MEVVRIHSLKPTAKAPENRPGPKRKLHRIPTIRFQVLLLMEKHPAPVDMVHIPLFTWLSTSQVG